MLGFHRCSHKYGRSTDVDVSHLSLVQNITTMHKFLRKCMAFALNNLKKAFNIVKFTLVHDNGLMMDKNGWLQRDDTEIVMI